MNSKKTKAFTLVELIVVITILAILWTIAFISLQWYSKDARDSTRLADLKSIEKALEFQLLKGSKIPQPDDFVEITASWTIISYQWYAWDGVLWKISVHWKGKDPLDDIYYTYLTDTNFSNYQLMWFLEWWELISYNNSILNQTKAVNYSERHPLVRWKPLWIIVNSTTKEPIQVTWTGIDIVTEIDEYELYLWNNDSITWTGWSLKAAQLNASCKRIKDINLNSIDWVYSINPTWTWAFEVYCDMTTDWGWWTLYTAKAKYGFPNTWYLSVNETLNNTNYDYIRWNYVSPSWTELPLIYKIFNQEEWNFILKNWQRILNETWIDSSLHYSTSQDFANAFEIWEWDNSWVTTAQFRKAVNDDWRNFFTARKAYDHNYITMWTAFRTWSNVDDYLYFPATPYNSTYRIWSDTFLYISNNSNWTDGRSISVFLK